MSNKEPVIIGKSPITKQKRARRKTLRATTGGKCWYCGSPTVAQGHHLDRDWLLIGMRFLMVAEHVIPTSRGGVDKPSNRVPACFKCNYEKGPFTRDEFRFVRGLQCGDLNFRFAFEEPAAIKRDWLICHSSASEKALVVHNQRYAADAYTLRRRSTGRPLYQPRVLPIPGADA